MHDSTTPSLPAAPNSASTSIERAAARASSTVVQTSAPLPEARPEALTTIGAPSLLIYDSALSRSVKVAKEAVGTLARRINSFAYAFVDSIRAARRVGPKIERRRS